MYFIYLFNVIYEVHGGFFLYHSFNKYFLNIGPDSLMLWESKSVLERSFMPRESYSGQHHGELRKPIQHLAVKRQRLGPRGRSVCLLPGQGRAHNWPKTKLGSWTEKDSGATLTKSLSVSGSLEEKGMP